MEQLRLWVLWVTDGDIQPFPTFVQGWNGLFERLKISARTAVIDVEALNWSISNSQSPQ
jgi:hypothetical protein